MDLRWEILAGYGPLFISGLWTTVQLTIVAIGAGLLLGVLLGLVSSSRDAPQPKSTLLAWALKAARGVTLAYVTFFRGTPLFVQILLVHFALMPMLVHPDTACCGPATPRASSARRTAPFLRRAGDDAQCRRLHLRDLPRRHPQHPPRPDQAAYSLGPHPRRRCASWCCRRPSGA